jgi:hypothetical protein
MRTLVQPRRHQRFLQYNAFYEYHLYEALMDPCDRPQIELSVQGLMCATARISQNAMFLCFGGRDKMNAMLNVEQRNTARVWRTCHSTRHTSITALFR